MYNLAVGAMFKNESHIIREWIEHYLFHGVEHFYMINDQSTDNSVAVLQPYIDRGLVTLYEPTVEKYLGRQRDMYNTFFMPLLKDKAVHWFLMIDLDEFVWSPMSLNLMDILRNSEHLCQIQIHSTFFGSNDHLKQPKFVVSGFTKRSTALHDPKLQFYKYFVNSKYSFTSLNVHHADHENPEDKLHRFITVNPEYFRLNHYSCQSRELWDTVKMTRGDSDAYHERNEEIWKNFNLNDVEDTGLLTQNKPLLERLQGEL